MLTHQDFFPLHFSNITVVRKSYRAVVTFGGATPLFMFLITDCSPDGWTAVITGTSLSPRVEVA